MEITWNIIREAGEGGKGTGIGNGVLKKTVLEMEKPKNLYVRPMDMN